MDANQFVLKLLSNDTSTLFVLEIIRMKVDTDSEVKVGSSTTRSWVEYRRSICIIFDFIAHDYYDDVCQTLCLNLLGRY